MTVGEVRQLERSKKTEVEGLTSELSVRDAAIGRLEGRLLAASTEHEAKVGQLTQRVTSFS